MEEMEMLAMVDFDHVRTVVNSFTSQLNGTERQQLALYIWSVFGAELGWPPRGSEHVLETVGKEINRAVTKVDA